MRKHTVRLLLEGRHGPSSLPRQTTVQRSKRVNTTVLRGVRTQIIASFNMCTEPHKDNI